MDGVSGCTLKSVEDGPLGFKPRQTRFSICDGHAWSGRLEIKAQDVPVRGGLLCASGQIGQKATMGWCALESCWAVEKMPHLLGGEPGHQAGSVPAEKPRPSRPRRARPAELRR